uniref:Putative toxin n=1 Tax=Didymocentrus krausi TaxID=1546215 RepID=A0A3S8V4Q1_9SCOR|nr:putative toxin [Didymocentrus krausi]
MWKTIIILISVLASVCRGEEDSEEGRTFGLLFSEDGRKILHCWTDYSFQYRPYDDIATKLANQNRFIECMKKALRAEDNGTTTKGIGTTTPAERNEPTTPTGNPTSTV